VHPIVELAKRAVEAYIRSGRAIATPEKLGEEMRQRAGVFVCLKRHGRLRGCIGTIQPVTGCVAEEAIRNAISAATEDPRFPPVEEEELQDMDYSVDVLCAPEKVDDTGKLDPRRYGVIVAKGMRRGLLLPDIEGVDSVQEQLAIARSKAGIGPEETDVEIYRFEVKRYK
jgi:AmmeMemoRadiSam system protein A